MYREEQPKTADAELPLDAPKPVSERKRQLLNRVADHLEAYLAEGKHPLRPKQVKVVQDIIDAARNGQWGGTVFKPTGTGKTVLFSAIIQALQGLSYELEEEHGPNSHGFLVLVPTTLLAEQTYDKLVNDKRKNGQPLFGFDPDDVAVLESDSSERAKENALEAPNLIMTYAYFHSLNKHEREALASRFFTIMDEVDVAKGEKRTPLLNSWSKSHFTLGFSATDKFLHAGKLRTINDELFDGEPPIHRTRLDEDAKDGEISPTRNVLFVTDLASGVERKLRHKDREFTEEEALAIANQPGRDAAAIKAAASFVDPNNGIAFKDLNQVWFCMGVTHASRVADNLNAVYQETLPNGELRYPHGYAVAVSGNTPKKDWIDQHGKKQLGLYSILDKHRTGEIPVLCNADLLIRGFDSPKTQLCVMLRPTRSPALTEQAGGRVARLDPDNPFKMAYVANFFDKDTESSLCFTDVAGGVYIGPDGGDTNAEYKPSSGEERNPNLDALEKGNEVEVITHFEPRNIQNFLNKTRDLQRDEFTLEHEHAEEITNQLYSIENFFKRRSIRGHDIAAAFNAAKNDDDTELARTGVYNSYTWASRGQNRRSWLHSLNGFTETQRNIFFGALENNKGIRIGENERAELLNNVDELLTILMATPREKFKPCGVEFIDIIDSCPGITHADVLRAFNGASADTDCSVSEKIIDVTFFHAKKGRVAGTWLRELSQFDEAQWKNFFKSLESVRGVRLDDGVKERFKVSLGEFIATADKKNQVEKRARGATTLPEAYSALLYTLGHRYMTGFTYIADTLKALEPVTFSRLQPKDISVFLHVSHGLSLRYILDRPDVFFDKLTEISGKEIPPDIREAFLTHLGASLKTTAKYDWDAGDVRGQRFRKAADPKPSEVDAPTHMNGASHNPQPEHEQPAQIVATNGAKYDGKGLFAEYLDTKIDRFLYPEERTSEGMLAKLHKRRVGKDFTLEQIDSWREGRDKPSTGQVSDFADALNLPLAERLKLFKISSSAARAS